MRICLPVCVCRCTDPCVYRSMLVTRGNLCAERVYSPLGRRKELCAETSPLSHGYSRLRRELSPPVGYSRLRREPPPSLCGLFPSEKRASFTTLPVSLLGGKRCSLCNPAFCSGFPAHYGSLSVSLLGSSSLLFPFHCWSILNTISPLLLNPGHIQEAPSLLGHFLIPTTYESISDYYSRVMRSTDPGRGRNTSRE